MQKPVLRAILFDKDGTIIDYWRTWLPINRKVALFAAGQDAALAADLLRLGGQDPETGRVVPGSALAAGSIRDIAEAFAQHPRITLSRSLEAGIDRIFAQGGADHSVLVPGARDTLVELRQRGFRLGLATNDSNAGLAASLADHDVLPLLDFTAGCDAGFGAKPLPGMVNAFATAVGCSNGAIAVVGDAVHDLAMGRAAGAGLNVAVLSGTSDHDDLAPYADLVLDSVADMPAHDLFQAPA
ncbi:MAG: HAD family hydrolase [Hyphomicrobiales bacterium]|nr:MAG: HAD family hydrolase [Hyphomicrobiales bacterium]